jgi:iron complex outermembrane receptor protein
MATLSGSVKDEASRPIAGASIQLLDHPQAATSNADGSFRLQHLFQGKYTIRIAATRYAVIHREALIQGGNNELNIILQSPYKRLDEVIVSALKKEEPLQKLPAGITALSARKAEEYRLWDVKDLTAIVPNLYAADPGDKRNVSSVRGIVSTSYDPAVATYVDGVNQFNLDTYIPQLFDVERIEVLRGPQGTLYGRNAMGGVINIITKRPTNHTDGFVQANAGNYGMHRYSAGIRTPLVKNKLFMGIAGLYDKNNGFYTNEFNGSQYDRQSSLVGNYYLRWMPAGRWSFILNAKHSHNRNRGPFPLIMGKEEALAHPFRLNQNAITKMVDNVFNTSLSVNHTGKHVNFSSQTSFQSNHRYYTDPIDADFSPLDIITLINNYGEEWNKVKVVTQELNLRSPASKTSPLRWASGTYLFHQRSPVKQATCFGEDAQLAGLPDKNFSLINTTRSNSTGAALYGEVGYAFSDKLELFAGLRYDGERKEQSILGEYQKDPDPNPVFPYRTDTVATASFSALSPKLGVSYAFMENKRLYATYSRGFRGGGLTPLSANPSQPPLFAFEPEYSNNVEAGMKNTYLANRLNLNLAVFYTTVTNAQVPTLVLPDAVTITRNTGKLTSKGFEAELHTILKKGLSIDYSFGYTDAEYKTLKVSKDGAEVNLKGAKQLFTPDVTSMLAAQYRLAIGTNKNAALLIRGEWKYLGTQYFDLANTIKQSPYHVFHSRAGIAFKKMELMLWGHNLSNKRYISYAYDFGAVHLGDPITYGMTMTVRF